jgi:hypothetical protein
MKRSGAIPRQALQRVRVRLGQAQTIGGRYPSPIAFVDPNVGFDLTQRAGIRGSYDEN